MITERGTPIEPLIIRGHHLFSIRNLLRLDESKSPHRRALEDTYQFVQRLEKGWFFQPKEYQVDLIGTTIEERREFIKRRVNFCEKLLTFPDTYPVKIVFEEPDDICSNCILGKHCTNGKEKGDRIIARWMFGDDNIETVSLGELKKAVKSYDQHGS